MNCVVPSEPPKDVFRISLCASDTVSPYSSFDISISYPVDDTQKVSLSLKPSFLEFHTVLYSSKDTIRFVPAAPLKGNTRYKLFISYISTSDNDSVVDSLDFLTLPHEQEPNNSSNTADRFTDVIFGSISTSNDTDFFKVTKKVAGFYLNSYYSQSVFSVSDNNGRSTEKREYRSTDSIFVPDSFVYPLILKVYGYFRSSGGNYKIGSFTK